MRWLRRADDSRLARLQYDVYLSPYPWLVGSVWWLVVSIVGALRGATAGSVACGLVALVLMLVGLLLRRDSKRRKQPRSPSVPAPKEASTAQTETGTGGEPAAVVRRSPRRARE